MRMSVRLCIKPSSQYDAEPCVASCLVALRRFGKRRVVHNFCAHARVRRTTTTESGYGCEEIFSCNIIRAPVSLMWRERPPTHHSRMHTHTHPHIHTRSCVGPVFTATTEKEVWQKYVDPWYIY